MIEEIKILVKKIGYDNTGYDNGKFVQDNRFWSNLKIAPLFSLRLLGFAKTFSRKAQKTQGKIALNFFVVLVIE